jgi:hypothetical protein
LLSIKPILRPMRVASRRFVSLALTAAGFWQMAGFLRAQSLIEVGAPSGLKVTAVGPTQMILAWTNNTINETGIRIERSTTSGSGYSMVGSTGSGVTNFSDISLAENTTYYYRVAATHASAVSPYSNEAYDTTSPQPATPVTITFDFQKHKYGLFVHYVYGGEAGNMTALSYLGGYPTNIDQLVNSFDATNFASQVAAMGVEYAIFTAYHRDMNVLYPSPKMVAWRGPGHSTTSRDLLDEVITSLAARGIKTMFYIHLFDGHAFHPGDTNVYYPNAGGIITQDQVNTGYYPAATTSDHTVWNNFMNDILGEIAQRYGPRLEGFYCDGVYSGVTDQLRLKRTMRSYNTNLIFVANGMIAYGDFDLGSRETSWVDATDMFGMNFDAPAAYPVLRTNVTTWLSYPWHVALVAAGRTWWSVASDINSAHYSADAYFKYTVLQAGANIYGGGVGWAAGCFGNGSFDPDFINKMTRAWSLMKPCAVSVTNTIPSTSFVTPPLASIDRLSRGFTATRSVDNRYDYIHVLRPPTGNTLQLPHAADGRTFSAAQLVATNLAVALATNAYGCLLTLPDGATWNTCDTVIRLTANLPLPTSLVLSPVADTRIMNNSNATFYAGTWDTTGVYMGRDRTLVRFELSGIPPGSVISAASLVLYASTQFGSNPSSNPLEVYRVTKPWAENTSSWYCWDGAGNNWDNPGGDAVGTNGVQLSGPYAINTSNPSGRAPVTWDIKSLVNAWVNGGGANQGLLIRQGGLADGGLCFWSREQVYPGLRPTLAILYIPPLFGPASNPDPADGAGEVAVEPVLSWQTGTNAILHQVYFGANSNAVAVATTNSAEFKGTLVVTNYSPGVLASSSRFFWRVDELGTVAHTNGVVWTFATLVNQNDSVLIDDEFSNQFTVTFPSQIGRAYRVEYTDSLNPANWLVLSNNIPGTGNVISIADPAGNRSSQAFYRVVILPP